jgi:hypothetical protein
MNQLKIGRPRSENPMMRTAVVLHQEMLKRLRSDAEAADLGVSAEIRRRLQLTYDQEGRPSDPHTTDLIKSIKKLADSLARDMGTPWYGHAYVLEAFEAGVAAFLAEYVVGGDARMRPDREDAGNPDAPPDDPPDVVGRTHARLISKERDKDELVKAINMKASGMKRKLANARED